MTSSTHNMASSRLSSRTLVTLHLEESYGLSTSRHQLLPTPTHDLLDTAPAPQLILTTIFHLKTAAAHGYRQLLKRANIANVIISPFSTLTLCCFVALLALHTKTVTFCPAYALGLSISVLMFLETYNTIYAMMMGLEFTLERIRTIAADLFCATGPLSLVVFSFGMSPGSGLGYEYSPGVDCMQEEDNAARKQQHRKERSTSETKVQLYNDLFPKDHYALKADRNTKGQQDNTVPFVLDATLQHESSKAQPATYKNFTSDLNSGQESNMEKAEDYLFPKTPELRSRESTFQMSLRKSMRRSKRPRRTRTRMSISKKECSSEDSCLKEGFRMTVRLEEETSGENSGRSTPDSEGSNPESDFQAGLRMMLGSACGKRRRGRRGIKPGPSTIESECSSQESEFQAKFREAVWPGVSSKRRTGTPGSETSSEQSGFQAEFRAMMGWHGRKRQIF